MHFICLQQSGKPVEGSSGQFWTLAGVAVREDRWRTLQLRVNGLQKSFHKDRYVPGVTRISANDILHPRNASRKWTSAFSKGLEKIAIGLELKFFLVVIDKATTDKPANPKWLVPLSYHYITKPMGQFLRESNSQGVLVIPPGREEERQALSTIQFTQVFAQGNKSMPIVGSPLIQRESDSAGLQVADFVATVAKRYHEHVYPKLFAKETVEGYDATINSHYQGFVKPNTYQSAQTDAKGFKIRGYIYLWRKDQGMGLVAKEEDTSYPSGTYPSGAQEDSSRYPSGSIDEDKGGPAPPGKIMPRIFPQSIPPTPPHAALPRAARMPRRPS